MQARVISVLEASASATPGIGFVVGGLIASSSTRGQPSSSPGPA